MMGGFRMKQWLSSAAFLVVFSFAVALLAPVGYCAGVFQVSTIDALLAGLYDGFIAMDELQERGNLGIGTFDRLDGELVMVDGVVYQIKADGVVVVPDASVTTPFAAVTHFMPHKRGPLGSVTGYNELKGILDG